MFVQNLRAKVGARLNGDSEAGFTLIELLVVMLILGILAAIALPAFFNQKEKAGDAKAKENAHSAQVAMETYATDNNGSYAGVSVTALQEIEPTVQARGENEETEEAEGAGIALSNIGANTYTIESFSSNGHEFDIVNNNGTLTYPCEPSGEGGCPSGAAGWGG